MGTVGIRELKQNASAVVARAKAGEIVTITDRGTPVAQLAPIKKSRLQELREAGLMIPATRSIIDFPPPPPAASDGPTLTERLLQMRDEERY